MADFLHISQTIDSVPIIKITLSDNEGDQGVYYWLEARDVNGEVVYFEGSEGDLQGFLTPTQITQLSAFMNQMRTKAEKLIPAE